jgi:hypothetical protein
LTGDAFGTGTAQSHIVPSTGQTGLYMRIPAIVITAIAVS